MDSAIERILRFNCPMDCDGNGSCHEMNPDGEWDHSQCQWCFEYGMPARDAIQSLIRTEKLKLLAEVRERVIGEDEPVFYGDGQIGNTPQEDRNELRSEQKFNLTKLEAEL